MKPIFKYSFLILLFTPFLAKGTTIDTAAVLQHITANLHNLKCVAYKYSMTANFPSGETDQLTGIAYMDVNNEFLFNDCDAFTMIYNGHWLYKADHRKKELTIINVAKEQKYDSKKAMKKDIFKNTALSLFADSALLSKAKIRALIEQDDVEKIELGFSHSVAIEKIDVVYNRKDSMLVSYDIYSFQPMQRTAKGITGIRTKIKCSDFKIVADKSGYEEANYFSINNGKIILKKYNTYKLFSKT
jgi:hypothetical protein